MACYASNLPIDFNSIHLNSIQFIFNSFQFVLIYWIKLGKIQIYIFLTFSASCQLV
nr:MAG TPA: hypothetical protein [Bacteriophage sp.]